MSTWSLEYSFDLDKKNRVIYAKVFGIWKRETAAAYHADFKAEVQPIIGKPWAKLIDLTNWKTSYPEVIDIIGQHMEWSRENNVAMSLYVLNNPSTFRQLHQMFTAGGTKEISQTFRTLGEAEQYLKENWLNKKRVA
ncbi:MAG TPA: hypothetical protein VMS71_01395 [Candidatus Acidoferrum sp.]|nr:hypothetical protein [Candidatus Acidoferrum sp.]